MPLLRKQLVGLAGMALVAGLVSQAESATGNTVKILDRWHVGGPDAWDYLVVDSTGQRLFMTRATRVEVVDTHSGKLVGTIPDTRGVHGIALAEDLNRGYASNGIGNSVTVFDLGTLKSIKEAPIPGKNPDAIIYDPKTKHLFTFNGKSNDVTVLDANTLDLIATIKTPGRPEFAVRDGESQLFDNIETEPGQLIVIDTNKLAVKATWTLPGCNSPSGLAIDKVHHRLFSVCDDNVMAVTDSVTGKQVAKVKIGEGPDAASYDEKKGLIYISNDDGTMTVVHQVSPDKYTVVQTLPTMKGARTMTLDPVSGKAYTISAELGEAPPPTPERPHPRRAPIPDTATVLVVGAP